MSSTTPHGAQRIEAESEGPAPLCAAWGEAVALMCEPTPAPALSAQARESLKGLAARNNLKRPPAPRALSFLILITAE
jgi:hypothetical protein